MNDIRTVVVKREGSVESGYAEMGGPLSPNMEVRALPWYVIISIRCGRVFFQSLLGTFTVTELLVITQQAQPDIERQLKLTLLTAGVTAIYTALQNAYELLTKLDQKYPEMRA